MSATIAEIISKHQQGILLVYTGIGKGKTGAALGQAMRALGHDKKVFFLGCTEHDDAIKELPGLTVVHKNNAGELLQVVKQILTSGSHELLIIDAVDATGTASSLQEELGEFLASLKNSAQSTDIIVTGKTVAEKIVSLADTVSFFTHGGKGGE